VGEIRIEDTLAIDASPLEVWHALEDPAVPRSSWPGAPLKPNNLLVRAMLPIIRRKFHETQRGILAALKESLDTHRNAVARA